MTRRFRPALLLLLLLGFLVARQSVPGAPSPSATPAVAPLPLSPAGALKITVAQNGIYRLPAARLLPFGLDLATRGAKDIALLAGDEPVPFWIDPAGPTLYFYGQAPASRYTAVSIYLLRWGQGGGVLMRQETLPRAAGAAAIFNTHRLEENHLYISRAALVVDEPWFWEQFAPKTSADYAFSLPDVVVPAEGAVRVGLWGATTNTKTDPDHRAAIALNGQPLGAIDWDGSTAITATLAIPAELLQSGENQLTLTAPGDTGNPIDLFHLDWIEVDYPVRPELRNGMLELPAFVGDLTVPGVDLLFDVTDPAAPLLLSPTTGGSWGGRSLVALSTEGGLSPLSVTPLSLSSWSDSSHQADYLIIAPAELTPQLEPLAAARRSAGLSVTIVPLEDIYDEFGAGEPTPLALNAFLQHAYQNWRKALRASGVGSPAPNSS